MHPAIEVVDRLIKERELRSIGGGIYAYPYGEGMMYECTSCSAQSRDDDCGIKHAIGCPTKELEEFKIVNTAQLKLLRELVVDSFEIRKLLCMAVTDALPFTEDGEIQDSSEFPIIDYLRDSSATICEKWNARLLNRCNLSK